MDIDSNEDLTDHINAIIEFLTEHGDVFYVALDVAYQLQDEILHTISEDPDGD